VAGAGERSAAAGFPAGRRRGADWRRGVAPAEADAGL